MQIYLARDGQREGPFTLDEARERLASGAASAADLAWYEGAANWLPLHQVPGLNVPPPPPPAGVVPPPPPPPPAAPQPAYVAPPVAPAPAPAPAKSSCAIIGVVLAVVGLILVAVIALLAAIAVPNFLRARKRSQATSTLETLRMIDGAMDQYAIETNRGVDFACTWEDLAPYVKNPSRLHDAMRAGIVTDALGHPIELTKIDHPPQVPEQTVRDTSDVISNPELFWGPYYAQ